MPSTIILFDDHPVFLQGLRHLLAKEKDLKIVGEVDDVQTAIDLVLRETPDLVVMDVSMPRLDGVETIRRVLSEVPDTKVVALLENSRRQTVRDVIQAGASGCILKTDPSEEMVDGIRAVLSGDVYLSKPISNLMVTDDKPPLPDAAFEPDGPFLPILQTKLHRPPIAAHIIPRARLIDELEKGAGNPMTLIAAPAGYGKSILASQWLATSEFPGAWVSLDEGDNDLRVFLSYIFEAIQKLFRRQALTSKSLLLADELPSVKVIGRYLLNDLETLPERFVMVLDDYHRIRSAAIHDFLAELLVHPSPVMHLAVLTRRDPPLPLASLRAKGMLNQITSQGLRFTGPETKSFLDGFLNITITDRTAQVLENKMEGWVTGLQLAALSIRTEADQKRFIDGLAETSQYVQEYLIQEVLSHVSPQFNRYLLQCSILDRFCAPLCEALSPEDSEQEQTNANGSARDFIDSLTKTHLFLIPLDTANKWFRYHHLFQELLQDRLRKTTDPGDISVLHSRAGAWFEAQGLLEEALQHTLATGDVERAAQFIERHVRSIMGEARMDILENWLSQLPREVVQERPLLLWAQAWCHYRRVEIGLLPAILDRIDGLISGNEETHPLFADVTVFRGLCEMLLQQDGARALKYIERALDLTGSVDQEIRRMLAELLFGLAGQMEGQRERVSRALTAWLDDASSLAPLRETNLTQTLVFTSYISADPAGTGRLIQRGRKVAKSSGLVSMAPWSDYLDGLFHLQRNDLDAALRLLEAAAEGKYFHHVRGALDGMCASVIAYQAQGEPERADAKLRSIDEYIRDRRSSFGYLADCCAARLALMQGKSETAVSWLSRTAPPPAEVMLFWFEVPCITWCRALIARGSAAGLGEAEAKLRDYEAMNEAHHNTCHLIEVLSLLAVACEKQGKADEALTVLERALTLARPGGFTFAFVEIGLPMVELLQRLQKRNIAVDHIERILVAFMGNDRVVAPESADHPIATPSQPLRSPTPSQGLVEPLTNRELDVLELLAERIQNQEIADKLFVSNQTVKTHLKNIYQKLNVKNRREAVARAYRLGIITRR